MVLHGLSILMIFGFSTSVGWGGDFQAAVQKNLFSPERRYEPYFAENKEGPRKDVLSRALILRGTLLEGKTRLAVIEVLPPARRELGLEDTSRRRFLVEEGKSLGDCPVLEILPEKIILGGRCQGLTLTLQDSPERKRAVSAEKKTLGLKNATKARNLQTRKPHPDNLPERLKRRLRGAFSGPRPSVK